MDVDDSGGEVDVAPGEREHLREPHSSANRGRGQGPVSVRRRLEQPGKLRPAEGALLAKLPWMGALIGMEPAGVDSPAMSPRRMPKLKRRS